jgi:processive 1,2-diacylglycerol beta-glucosyltransferase
MENKSIRNATCYSFHLNSGESLGHLRLTGPLTQAGISIISGIEGGQVLVSKVSEGDIVIFQRDFPIRLDEYSKVIETAHKEGKPVVFDLDDLLFSLPSYHPAAEHYTSSLVPMFHAMSEVDLITVTTTKLKEVLNSYFDNVVVLPNYLDDGSWRLNPPNRVKPDDGVITIGYMGGHSHEPDLEYIAPVLFDILARYPQNVHFQFWGTEPPEELRSLPQVSYTSTYFRAYKDFAEFFQKQSADIFLAPLVDNLFNRCKSPIKFLEYGALGAPGVFSNLETYNAIVTHGENGFLASSLEQWSKHIIQLIEDAELRFRLATSAQATIREHWLLSKNSLDWKSSYSKLFDLPRKTIHTNETDIGHSMATQVLALMMKKENNIHALEAKLAAQESNIQEITEEKRKLEVEAAHYAGSMSWRITRPLRKISAKIKRNR